MVLEKLNCQSFPPEQITKQLETRKRGGREWKRAVLSLVPAYVCSWSLSDLFRFFLPEAQSAQDFGADFHELFWALSSWSACPSPVYLCCPRNTCLLHLGTAQTPFLLPKMPDIPRHQKTESLTDWKSNFAVSGPFLGLTVPFSGRRSSTISFCSVFSVWPPLLLLSAMGFISKQAVLKKLLILI